MNKVDLFDATKIININYVVRKILIKNLDGNEKIFVCTQFLPKNLLLALNFK